MELTTTGPNADGHRYSSSSEMIYGRLSLRCTYGQTLL